MSNPYDIPFSPSLAALRAIPTVACGVQFPYLNCLTGIDTSNTVDRYHYDSGSTAADNGSTIIKPTDNAGAGRWVLSPYTWVAAGGYPNRNQPPDEPANIENISTDSRVSCLATTGYGTVGNAVFHFNKARGTQAVPTIPLSGDNIASVGMRAYDSVSGTFDVSSAAIETVLTEDARSGGLYTGCYVSIEATAPGGGVARQPIAYVLGQQCLNVGSSTYHSTSVWAQSNNNDRPFGIAGVSGQLLAYTGGGSATYTNGESTANSTFYLRKDSGTSRSLNAAGTVNASGADYADYETKSADCGDFEKGSLVGYDSEGYLTDKFSKAVSFGVKSTDPSFVGGDTHWTVVKPSSTPLPAPPKTSDPDYVSKIKAYEVVVSEHNQSVETLPGRLKVWEEELEKVRSKVDRIAKAGRVPCIVSNTPVSGKYVIASLGANDSIEGLCVDKVSDENSDKIVGKIRTVNPSEERLRVLISESVSINPKWNTLVEVIHS